MSAIRTVGIVGGRGHTGRVLLQLIAKHEHLKLAYASSREYARKLVSTMVPELMQNGFNDDIEFKSLTPKDLESLNADLVVLALPDGAGAPFVAALERQKPETIILDLSADYRFTDEWVYGLPELLRLKGDVAQLNTARRIANPGCYATAMQLSIAPILNELAAPPSVFGVSGYFGAGMTPSPKNNPMRLKDNLMPYKLTGHNHEREATRHLGATVYFTPHVHPAFSGIVTTTHLTFKDKFTHDDLFSIFKKAYADESLITILRAVPELKQYTNENGILLGGFEVSADGYHGVIVAAEDNLRKGAAIQAMQNINIALGFNEFLGIET